MPTTLRESLRLRLRELRERKGLTIKEAAARAAVSEGYWLKLEAGERWPSDAILTQLAEAMGVQPTSLLRG